MTRRRGETAALPPHSIEAEQAVLGAAMLHAPALAEIRDWLSEDDFYRRDHQLIYQCLLELTAKGAPCDAVTVSEWVQEQGVAEMTGGASYALKIANDTPSAANIVAYAEIVREKSRLRQAMDVGATIMQQALDPKARSADVIAVSAQTLAAMNVDARAGGPRAIGDSLGLWYQDLARRFELPATQRVTGIETPWEALTDLTAGFQPECYMIAGRPNMGKSVAGFQIAARAARAGHRTLIFSMEQRRDAVIQRMVACYGGVPHECLRKPWLMEDEHWPAVTSAMEAFHTAPLLIDDQKGLTPQQIVARAQRQHLRTPLALVEIDHLHEMRLPGRGRFGELGEAVKYVRDGIGELGVSLVFLAQLSRANTARTDRRPQMADLRGDGAIEEVADAIFFLHREDYYDKDTHLKNVVELIVGKGRDMPTGSTVYLANRFDEMRLEAWDGPLPKPVPKEPKEPKSKKGATLKDDADAYASKGAGE